MTGPLPALPSRLSRRWLLGGALALAAGTAGCGTAAPREGADPGSSVTVASLVGERPFYAAHRGGGANWPEMTAYAYEQASAVPGLKALEISVCRSSDGVLVCSHDATTTRVTGVSYTIARETWQTLSTLQVSAAGTTDPSQPSRPLARLEEVVDRYIGSHVLFVEPKVGAATDPLMKRITSYGRPEHVVWKQPVNSTAFATAREAGFGTWGYVLDERGHLGKNLQRFAASPDIDLLGAPRANGERFVAKVVEAAQRNGKQTIGWEVRSVADRALLLRLGVTGLMTSNVVDVVNAPL